MLPVSTLAHTTLCSRGVCLCAVCYVCVSEQTAFVFLHSINWLVFITEKEGVYCEVRAGSLNIIEVNFGLQEVNLDSRRK